MKIKILISFAIIYIVWGSTFTAIKFGLESFPPIALAASRFMIAGLVFLAFAKWKEIKNMSWSDLRKEGLIGILLNTGNAGVCWSEQYISSGVAALIVGAIPIIFMVFNWAGFERKIPHYSAFFAVILGIVGISLISGGKGDSGSNWAVIIVLLVANFSWVIGSLKFRLMKSNASYYSRAAVQLICGSTTLFGVSALLGEKLVVGQITSVGFASVLYLAVAGTLIAYTAYSYLLKNVKTELASTYALINPLVALILGVLFLNEPFTAMITLSAALITFSVVLTLYGDKLFKRSTVKILPSSKEAEMRKCG